MAEEKTFDVLVVEDNEINQQVFQMMLEMEGVTSKIVDTGKAALSAWQMFRPKVILMDINMADMDGHEVTRRIREIEASTGDRVPIIACTANALRGDEQKCFDAGMDDYLSKPVSPEKLLAAIRYWTDRAENAGARAAS